MRSLFEKEMKDRMRVADNDNKITLDSLEESNKTCDKCVFYEKFIPRKDEISDQGCTKEHNEGYIIDINFPPCGRILFRKRKT